MPTTFTRRRLLKALCAAGAVGITGAPVLAGAEALETTTLRLVNDRSICIAPEYMAEELLRVEGFTDIRYVEVRQQQTDALLRGEIDFTNFFPGFGIRKIDAGAPIVVLAGIHIGCFEFFAREGIRHIAELKGKTIGLRNAPAALLTLMAAEVGLDPAKDIRWVTSADRGPDPLELFVQGAAPGPCGGAPRTSNRDRLDVAGACGRQPGP
jgi:NitT/TauT family transport system substrate-binding protein